MLRLSSWNLKSQHHNVLRRSRPHIHKYRELNRWQRQAQGISKWDQSHSHRPLPYVERFNPESVGLTRGTSAFAWKWWHTQYPWLPNVPPEAAQIDEAQKQERRSHRPPAWDDEFAKVVLNMNDAEIREYLMSKLTDVIFLETQRDGYELRRLDFEGKPLTSLPEPRIIENFVLEEETIRERVIYQVVEGVFRLSPTSADRRELRSVANIIDYVLTHVRAARPTDRERRQERPITSAALAVMQKCPIQPQLGFVHALPHDTRDALLQEWERMHHLDWQFGKAVYTPRSKENVRGNLTWLREDRHYDQRMKFMQEVESGEARAKHMKLIAAAAGN
ncbi:uncharacterized protein TEOVI_000438700 [Trypanosoma equiperdum]|uniref:Uncharacterized protein n=4 Tax=Trypanozoon TaxID=39700 RepID=Q383M2_TRYB2|nr:hypothetical protein, conserved [Trypanosoma brucei gambiense DAL972]XP_829121.1 hypothetical protein, conserved [Trypanosoma brucei brucei TREU927]RHW68396.1 hypothetical protein DPX39_110080800 [Trypanosoma brucei equiperdum]SCU72803.1 hypothetical protein, conserved [Trypanosoma equiperdum]EAN80009.1 hypothetical protein, conserved [Trypanosoma brucei brucei TREU927]CBH18067.1 hypothetical protein, conserved [Trypanosoma brucei gambiense DAL972]|eukprot:XP_011780331.1 hypothetical protein, conserved [Trypanosoma brucei gambiense DAL972]